MLGGIGCLGMVRGPGCIDVAGGVCGLSLIDDIVGIAVS